MVCVIGVVGGAETKEEDEEGAELEAGVLSAIAATMELM
jgi:hypothetical protein